MAKESELGDGHAQGCCERQLEPGVAQEKEARPDTEERRNVRTDLQPVVKVPSLEETSIVNGTHEIGIAARVLLGTGLNRCHASALRTPLWSHRTARHHRDTRLTVPINS